MKNKSNNLDIVYSCESLLDVASRGEPVVIHSVPNGGKTFVMHDLFMKERNSKPDQIMMAVDSEGCLLNRLNKSCEDLPFSVKSKTALYTYLPLPILSRSATMLDVADQTTLFIDAYSYAIKMATTYANTSTLQVTRDNIMYAMKLVYRESLLPLAKAGGKVFIAMQSSRSATLNIDGFVRPEHEFSGKVFKVERDGNLFTVTKDSPC